MSNQFKTLYWHLRKFTGCLHLLSFIIHFQFKNMYHSSVACVALCINVYTTKLNHEEKNCEDLIRIPIISLFVLALEMFVS